MANVRIAFPTCVRFMRAPRWEYSKRPGPRPGGPISPMAAPQTSAPTGSKILRGYADKTPGSRALHERAKVLLSNGVTHVSRYLEPHPVYVQRAAGPRKWDVDGNEYVDYFGGDGALILGHNHPGIVGAVTGQMPTSVHYRTSPGP